MAGKGKSGRGLRAWLTLGPLSRAWRWGIFAALAVAIGLAAVVGKASNAASYLSDEPETCMNCHVMTNAYATWERGSHGRRVAVCNDCHVPHTSTVAKMSFKAQDGLRHSYVFTFRLEPQVLRLSEGAKPVIQDNCIRCHGELVSMLDRVARRDRHCWDCHSNIHGSVRSLSASPNVRRPEVPPAGLKWLE